MRIVDEAVQDGVGVSGVANDLMPGRQGELGGDDRRPSAVSLLENFEQIVTGAGVEGFEAEVVENEQIGAAEGFDEARMAAVASGERQVLAELRPAMIEDGAIVATEAENQEGGRLSRTVSHSICGACSKRAG